jgi:hypothetical protein
VSVALHHVGVVELGAFRTLPPRRPGRVALRVEVHDGRRRHPLGEEFAKPTFPSRAGHGWERQNAPMATSDCHDRKAEWVRLEVGERSWRVRLQPG